MFPIVLHLMLKSYITKQKMARLKSVCDTLIQNGDLNRVGLNTEHFFRMTVNDNYGVRAIREYVVNLVYVDDIFKNIYYFIGLSHKKDPWQPKKSGLSVYKNLWQSLVI